MRKVNLFREKIIKDNEVYLLAEDVSVALGYETLEEFAEKYSDIIIKERSTISDMILESDFNHLLLLNVEVLKKLGHIEITKVETLRSRTEVIKSFYPLKYMLEGELVKYKAFNAGFSSVDEYIETVELPKDIEEEKNRLLKENVFIASTKDTNKKIQKLVDFEVLEKYGLCIQQYTHIKEGSIYIENFLVGKGIFFALYDSDYAFDLLRIQDKNLVIPTYNNDDEFEDCNYGYDTDMRDYREHTTLENILHIITHKKIEDAGVDLMRCEVPGINFYISQTEVIKLLNPNMYRDIILINGSTDFDYSKIISGV